jgi:hypothetical protein
MNPIDFTERDVHVVMAHFPDAADCMLVPDRHVSEASLLSATLTDLDIRKIDLLLQEIEPETGIYACMSPLTRRVYVYVGDPSSG